MPVHHSILAPLFLLVSTTPAYAQFPILYTWPGPSPCSGTLQACIDAAGADDSVEIATNGPIDEDIVSYGSLDLMAAFGFTPRFAPFRFIQANSSGSSDQAIRIQGLTLDRGRIRGVPRPERRSADRAVPRQRDRAIGLHPDRRRGKRQRPPVLRIQGNDIEGGLGSSNGICVYVVGSFVTAHIERNEIRRLFIDPIYAAIDLLAVEGGALVADVFRNTVHGDSYFRGVRAQGDAGTNVRIVGNAIESVNTSDAAGIEVALSTAPDGVIDSQIVNNTVRYSTRGIVVSGGDAQIANNILSGMFEVGLSVTGTGGTNRNNLFFDNNPDVAGTAAGPGSVFADPGFAPNLIDFRIPPTSPAAEAGNDAALPAEFTTDLYGDPRRQGAHVDIGAVEAPEPSAAPLAIAALAALLCVRRMRRQISV